MARELPGQRIVTKGVRLPRPSAAILSRMARSMHIAMEENRALFNDDYVIVMWEELDDAGREELIIGARACFRTLACNAGAKTETIEEQTS